MDSANQRRRLLALLRPKTVGSSRACARETSRRDSEFKSLGRSSYEPSNDMALPHPQSRKNHYRKEDKPNSRGVIWNLFKRTINVADYRNGKDDVDPAKNRAFGGLIHDWCDPPRFVAIEPRSTVSRAFQYRTAWRTPRSIAASL